VRKSVYDLFAVGRLGFVPVLRQGIVGHVLTDTTFSFDIHPWAGYGRRSLKKNHQGQKAKSHLRPATDLKFAFARTKISKPATEAAARKSTGESISTAIFDYNNSEDTHDGRQQKAQSLHLSLLLPQHPSNKPLQLLTQFFRRLTQLPPRLVIPSNQP
jgi:hypothetical protein